MAPRIPLELSWINREALAWAAGLFDGEGTICAQIPRPGETTSIIVAAVSQAGDHAVELLERFRTSVNLGRVYKISNPGRSGGSRLQCYHWRVSSFQGVQAVMAMLWPWLGPGKRAQTKRVLAKYHAAKHGNAPMTTDRGRSMAQKRWNNR